MCNLYAFMKHKIKTDDQLHQSGAEVERFAYSLCQVA